MKGNPQQRMSASAWKGIFLLLRTASQMSWMNTSRCRQFLRFRGGARRGLEGAVTPCQNMLAPRRKVKSYFVGDFWHLHYPESRILASSSEESAPLSENSWCHPCSECALFMKIAFVRPWPHESIFHSIVPSTLISA